MVGREQLSPSHGADCRSISFRKIFSIAYSSQRKGRVGECRAAKFSPFDHIDENDMLSDMLVFGYTPIDCGFWEMVFFSSLHYKA